MPFVLKPWNLDYSLVYTCKVIPVCSHKQMMKGAHDYFSSLMFESDINNFLKPKILFFQVTHYNII